MPTPLDEPRQLVDGRRPPPAIATLIGFTLTAVSPGEAVIELAASRQHANPMGALHGGVLCDIADAAMGIAYASTLAEGETFATIELKIHRVVAALERAGIRAANPAMGFPMEMDRFPGKIWVVSHKPVAVAARSRAHGHPPPRDPSEVRQLHPAGNGASRRRSQRV
jgi:uncharacterized protein (TIGR00369 family)